MKRKGMRRKSHPVGMMMLMVMLGVGCGYLGVDHFVSPWMEQQTELEQEVSVGMELPGEETTVIEDQLETVIAEGYGVQLGSFSSEATARERVEELADFGIPASVVKKDNGWKVISHGFSTEEEARAAAEQWNTVVEGAFLVRI